MEFDTQKNFFTKISSQILQQFRPCKIPFKKSRRNRLFRNKHRDKREGNYIPFKKSSCDRLFRKVPSVSNVANEAHNLLIVFDVELVSATDTDAVLKVVRDLLEAHARKEFGFSSLAHPTRLRVKHLSSQKKG